jgi:glycosyltransferase involved in cell wall biosynthesis
VRVLAADFRHPGVGDGDEAGVERCLRWYWRDHEFAWVGPLERLRMERHNHAALERAIGELRPDVVAFWSMGAMSHGLIEAVRLRGLPMVAFVHDEWLDYGRFTDQWLRIYHLRPLRRLPPLVARLTGLPTSVHYGRAGRWVFVSDYVRRRAREVGHVLPDTAVAHSGIHPDFLGPAEARSWRGRLLFVGRLHPDKGIHDAVRALAELPEMTLTFAGSWDPREERALAALVAELGLEDRVTMRGRLERPELRALYRDSDALLFPGRWNEPWGLVPLEAMASGCPVVATARGGSAEYLVDGDNALVVPAEDPGALAAAVRRLCADAALRDRLRAGGARTAPLHTEPRFNAEVERHLLEIAGLPAPAPGRVAA